MLNDTFLSDFQKQPALKNVAFDAFFILAFFTNLCPIKSDLSGNTVWPQTLGLQKLAKVDHFWHF